MRVMGDNWDAQAVLQDRSHENRIPVKEGGGGSAHLPGSRSRDVVEIRDIQSPWVACSVRVSSV